MAERFPRDWTFRFDANYAWIDAFVGQFPGGDIVIISDDWDAAATQYRWSSPHLNGLTDAGEIGARAAALKALFDGAMLLHRKGDYRLLPVDRTVEHSGAGFGDFQLRHPFEPFSADWKRWTFDSSESPMRHPVSTFLFLAHYSQTAKDMLLFLGANGVSWISLYALKDFMAHEKWSEDEMASAGNVSVAELKRFRATANNHAAIGPFARHGEAGWTPPKVPMTLDKAHSVILDCVGGFMAALARKLDLTAVFAAKCR